MMQSIWPAMVLACVLSLLVPSAVAGDAESDYLDFMEQQVESILHSVQQYAISCDVVASCRNQSATSICDSDTADGGSMATSKTLWPTESLHSGSRVWQEPKERFNDKDLWMDYSKIFEMAIDPLMKDIASLNQSITRSRPFFGSIDGTWRVFPDFTERSVDSLSYHPRTRPWYLLSTSVVKVVVVLIDLSPSMAYKLPPNFGSGTLLEAAKTIASQLLLTLNSGDHVNIIIFDGTRVFQLAPSAVLVQSQSTTKQAELDPLRVELNKLQIVALQVEQQPLDLNVAILDALPNFDSNPLAAKVIVVITDGIFATLENVILPSANLTGVKVFMYKLPQSNDITLIDDTLIHELCAIGGHFEPIMKNLEDPLLVLHNYFSYLANLKRILTMGRPQYNFVHQDLEQMGGNIILVTKLVFWKNGLLGVAGITIYIELLGSLTASASQVWQSKITNYSVPMAPVILSTANCTIVSKTPGAFSQHGGPNCFQTCLTHTITSPDGSRPIGHHNSKKWAVVIGATICLAIFILFGSILQRHFKNQSFHKEYVDQGWPLYYNELKDFEGNSTKFLDYSKLALDSMALVQNIVEEANVRPLQLNDGQCKVVAQELAIVRDFLAKTNKCMANQNGIKALCHLYYAIKKASLLIEKCSCKTSESWIVTAMTLVDVQECFVAIILDLQLWRMVLDIVITSSNVASHHKQKEMLMIMEEEYHKLYKNLHRSDGDLQEAALEDKNNILLKLEKLRELENDLEYPYVIHLSTWLGQFEDGVQMTDINDQERLTKFEDPMVLGTGGCGTVFCVTWLGSRCALKILNVKDESEATTLKGLSHPNIIRLYHYWEALFDNPKSHLLMELMVVDLDTYIEKLINKAPFGNCQNDNAMPFSLPVAIDIMLQVANAMQYLHERHLAHRDLKTTNILVKQMCGDVFSFSGESYLEVKLADFGLAKAYNNTSTGNRHTMNTGTPVYGAPEIFGSDLATKRNFPPMADVWSFGMTCAEILSGKKPYVDVNRRTLQSRIANENLRPSLPKCCPSYLAFCISSCWEFQPQRRPNFANISKMLRHAKLLSLNLTNLDDSKMFLGYTTQRNCVKGFSTNS